MARIDRERGENRKDALGEGSPQFGSPSGVQLVVANDLDPRLFELGQQLVAQQTCEPFERTPQAARDRIELLFG